MTTNQTYKPSEGKREEFRKYLEKNGIMDALTKVLVNLYEEPDKPEDALQYPYVILVFSLVKDSQKSKLKPIFCSHFPSQYILDKLSIQAGLETQKQLLSKLEEANNHVKALEEELEQLRVAMAPRPEDEPGEVPPEEGAEAVNTPAEDAPLEEQPPADEQ
ncbi:unnamed protein product [Acanthoscelides obtectus]|uniref:c-Myc-binding protein n=1 Tax=Acanthoscelides obtectus TaxID=200917 RepID=A0A9P0PL47_ACAOB|nr:unnamed protein product [Acanthoscelides obtectus]CAK1636315.1 c-Myc-binding protein [Acanthoscelides obtectus]